MRASFDLQQTFAIFLPKSSAAEQNCRFLILYTTMQALESQLCEKHHTSEKRQPGGQVPARSLL
jgi:hypothetical protein